MYTVDLCSINMMFKGTLFKSVSYESPIECISLSKSKIGFSNPKESENGFCVSLLDTRIQDLSDHGASKNPLSERILWFL